MIDTEKYDDILTETIDNYKDEIIETVINQILKKFPKLSFDRNTCTRDILLIFKCVLNDVVNKTSVNSTKAAFSYIYHYNKLIFSNNKERILFSIRCIQDALIEKLPNDPALKQEVKNRFELMYEIVNQKIVTEISWWTYSARILPYIALSGLILTHLVAPTNLYTMLAIAIIVVFFSAGVFWWWWAIWKIAYIFSSIKNAQHSVVEVYKSIKQLKVDINEELSPRERGEPTTSKRKESSGNKNRM